MNIRNLLRLFLLITVCVSGFARADAQEPGSEAVPEPKVLVVYYSREGHTKLVAEQLAKKFGADLEQLIDRKKRIGPIAFTQAGRDAIAWSLTVIDPLKLDPKDYDIILIGTPSWFGNMSPAVRTFVTQNDVSAKKIGVFGTAHLTGVEHALQEIADLIAKEKSSAIPRLPLRHRDLVKDVLPGKIDSFYKEVMK